MDSSPNPSTGDGAAARARMRSLPSRRLSGHGTGGNAHARWAGQHGKAGTALHPYGGVAAPPMALDADAACATCVGPEQGSSDARLTDPSTEVL